MKFKIVTSIAMFLTLICVSCDQTNGSLCLDEDGDGAFVDVTHSNLSDAQWDLAFSCVPVTEELDCDDADASVNPSISEDAEDQVDLNCNGLVQGSESVDADLGLEACQATTTVDTDADGIMNECDSDDDDDGILDDADNCKYTPNPMQEDVDVNGIGDVCAAELDADGDGVADDYDTCAYQSNLGQADRDEDGYGDECDSDPDDPEVGMQLIASSDLISALPSIDRLISSVSSSTSSAIVSSGVMTLEPSRTVIFPSITTSETHLPSYEVPLQNFEDLLGSAQSKSPTKPAYRLLENTNLSGILRP